MHYSICRTLVRIELVKGNLPDEDKVVIDALVEDWLVKAEAKNVEQD